MSEIILIPLLACIVLTGIHTYFGVHVIDREIIFVDLALAQVAALGSIVAFLLGFKFQSTISYLFSLLFALIGASIFSFARPTAKKFSQEAVVGIVYAVSTALSILLLTRAPAEAEHIKYMLVGNILFVSDKDVIKISVLYSAIGLFHYFFFKKFLTVTENYRNTNHNFSHKVWDFLFYTTFGVVVTSSVKVAGVLLVFSFLIVPAFCASLFYKGFVSRLITGWLLGILASGSGIILSVIYDLPTGPTIVGCFGIITLLSSLLLSFTHHP